MKRFFSLRVLFLLLWVGWSSGALAANVAENSTKSYGYSTLQSAIDAASEGDEIRLLCNLTESVSFSKNITINLNYYTLTGYINVQNSSGTVTLKNGTVKSIDDGSGTQHYKGNIIADNVKVLTDFWIGEHNVILNNCTIDNVYSDGGGPVTINSGYYNTVGANVDGNVTINGGYFKINPIRANTSANLADRSLYIDKVKGTYPYQVDKFEMSDDGYALIYTSAQLAGFGRSFRSGSDYKARLASSRCSLEYTTDGSFLIEDMMGSGTCSFGGVFDGNGQSITLKINDVGMTNAALFPYVSGATIKNLKLYATNQSAQQGSAGIVGKVTGSTQTTIEQCVVLADITPVTNCGYIVGENEGNLLVRDCYSGTYNSTFRVDKVRGILGYNAGTFTAKNCLVNAYTENELTFLDRIFTDESGNYTLDHCVYVSNHVETKRNYNDRVVALPYAALRSGYAALVLNTVNPIWRQDLANNYWGSQLPYPWGDQEYLVEGHEDACHNRFLSGDGTVNDPLQIGSESDLKLLNSWVIAGNPKLCAIVTNDFDLGTSGLSGFQGSFDGNGHTINVPSAYTGMFSLKDGGSLSNLRVTGKVTLSGWDFGGGIVASTDGSVTISNCISEVEYEIPDFWYYGGIVGSAKGNLVLNNCAFTGSFKSAREDLSNAGGLVGYLYDSTTVTANNCYVYTTNSTLGSIFCGAGDATRTYNNCYYNDNIGVSDAAISQASAATPEQFANGEACYLLNTSEGGESKRVWLQTLTGDNKDPLPTLWNSNFVFKNGDSYYNVDKPFAGSGNMADPYRINTPQELEFFRDYVNGNIEGATPIDNACARLMADLDMSDRYWEPIGRWTVDENGTRIAFKGTFDGNNHVIRNLSASSTTDAALGFIGCAGEGCVVKSLILQDEVFDGPQAVGGLIGIANADVTIDRCATYGSLRLTINNTSTGIIGGMVGNGNGHTVTMERSFTSYNRLIGTSDQIQTSTVNAYGNEVANTAATGALAYKLNGNTLSTTTADQLITPWGQILEKEAYPILLGKSVYYYDSKYSNHLPTGNNILIDNNISNSLSDGDFKVYHHGGRLYEFVITMGTKDDNGVHVMPDVYLSRRTSSGTSQIAKLYDINFTEQPFEQDWVGDLAVEDNQGVFFNAHTYEKQPKMFRIQQGNHKTSKAASLFWMAPEDMEVPKAFMLTSTTTGSNKVSLSTEPQATPAAVSDGSSNVTAVDPVMDTESSEAGLQTLYFVATSPTYGYGLWDATDNKFLEYREIADGTNSLISSLPQHDNTHNLVGIFYVMKTDVDGSGATDTTYVNVTVPVEQKPFHKISTTNSGITEENKDAFITTKTLKWALDYVDHTDLLESDVFMLQRAFEPTFTNATILTNRSLTPADTIVQVEGANGVFNRGWYEYTDDGLDSLSTELNSTDRKSIFDEWTLNDADRALLTSYKFNARYAYYKVYRTVVNSMWGEQPGYSADWKVLMTNVLPNVSRVGVEKSSSFDTDHKVSVTVRLDNPYPWQLTGISDATGVQAEAKRQGWDKRMFNWDDKATLTLRRYSPQDEWYDSKNTGTPIDEVAKTITIKGTDVKWNEEDGYYYATVSDVQSAPYTHYYYEAVVDTTKTNYAICNNAAVSSSEEDADKCYSETMAGISDFAATQGTAKGQVLLTWQTDDGVVEGFRIERKQYATTDDAGQWADAAWTSIADLSAVNSYKDQEAREGEVSTYRITAYATFRGVQYTNEAIAVGYCPYLGSISGRLKMQNGAAFPGKMPVTITSNETVDYPTVKNSQGEVIMQGLSQSSFTRTLELDETGSFVLEEIPYVYDGTDYIVAPVSGTMHFTNATGVEGGMTVTLSHNNIDVSETNFTCSDTKQFSGRVLFAESTVPVRDVQFVVNDTVLTNAQKEPIVTDQNGNFSFYLPRGMNVKSLKAYKNGHQLSGEGAILGGTNKDKEAFTVTDNLDGLNLTDYTTVRLVGRLIGGDRQAEIPIGLGRSTNNLGDNMRVVLQLDGNGTAYTYYNSKNPDETQKTVTSTQTVTKASGLVADYVPTTVEFQRKSIVITPDPITGEFCADIFPAKYKITELSAKGYSSLYNDEEGFNILDLSDSITVKDVSDNEWLRAALRAGQRVSDLDVRNTTYQAIYQHVSHVPVTVSMKQVSLTGEIMPYLGEQTINDMNIRGIYTKAPVAWTNEEGKVQYLFGYPVFQQDKSYIMQVSAHEDFYYNNDKQTEPDVVQLKGGKVILSNGLEGNASRQEVTLGNEGTAMLTLKVANPAFADGTPDASLRNINSQVLLNGYYYSAEPIKGYVLGHRDTGTNLLTIDNTVSVVDVVRDPYGANSYAYREKGTEYGWSRTKSSNSSATFDMGVTLGAGFKNAVGLGFSLISDFAVTGSFEFSVPMYIHYDESEEGAISMRLNERVTTSADPADQGAMSDVYIGFVNTVNIGQRTYFCVIDQTTYDLAQEAIASGAVQIVSEGTDEEGNRFWLAIGDKYTIGEGVSRTFIYSQKHILQTLIPELKKKLSELVSTGDVPQLQELADKSGEPVYYYASADSIVMLEPTNANATFENKAQTILTTIDQWESRVYENEKEKAEMINTGTPFKSYSVADAEISYEEEATAYYDKSPAHTSHMGDDDFTGSAGIGVGGGGGREIGDQDDDKGSSGSGSGSGSSSGSGSGSGSGSTTKPAGGQSASTSKSSGTPASGTKSGGSVCGLVFDISLTPFNWSKSFENSKSSSKVSSAGSGFVISTNNNGYMDIDVYRTERDKVGLEDSEFDFIVTKDADKEDKEEFAYHNFVFTTRGGASRAPWLDADSTIHYQPSKTPEPLSARLLKIDNPKIYIDNPVVSNVPLAESAIYNVRLTNESEVSNLSSYLEAIPFTLRLDDNSNPQGAKILMDGMPLTDGRLFELAPGQSITKTIEVARGNGYDFNDLGLILRDETNTLSDEAYLSVHFLPQATPIYLAMPKDKWIMNTLSAHDEQGYYIPVEVNGFDINYDGFHHIELQYKKQTEGESQWVNLCSFFANDSLYQAASGEKKMLTTGSISNVRFYGEQDPVEMKYDLRAVSFCQLGTGFVTASSTIASGTKDTRAPKVFGKPKPVNGILTFEDVISLPFNEAIAYNYLDETANFTVQGYTNQSDADHSTSLMFPGTETQSAQSKVARSLSGHDFTIEMMVQAQNDVPNPDETSVFCRIDDDFNGEPALSFGYDTQNRQLVATMGSQTYRSVDLQNVNVDVTGAMTHVGMMYNATDGMVQFIAGSNTISSDASNTLATASTANGNIQLGQNFKGNMADLRLWSRCLNTYEIANKYQKTPQVGEKGLVAYYPMNETMGRRIEDKVNGADIYLNEVTWTTPQGVSVALNGEPLEVAEDMRTKFQCDAQQDYSLAFWFKANQLKNASGQDATASDDVLLFKAGGDELAETGKNKMRIAFNSGTVVLKSEGQTQAFGTDNDYASDAQWHHLAISVNHAQNVAALFIDGNIVNTVDADKVGGIAGGCIEFGGKGFYGNIDDVQLWHLALPSSYLSSYYNVAPTGKEADLKVYMPFEQNAVNEQNSTYVAFSECNQIIVKTTNKIAGDVMLDMTAFEAAGHQADSDNHSPVRTGAGIENLPFDWTCTDNELQININKQDADINHQQLLLTVRLVEDLQGNPMANPQMWTVYVNRNVLTWDNENLSAQVTYGNEQTLNASWKNKSGRKISYTLDTSAPWLSLSKTMGSMDPLASEDVELSISDGLSPGIYTAYVYLTDEDNLVSRLALNVTVTTEKPNWEVTTDLDYAQTMNLIGRVMKRANTDDNADWVVDMTAKDMVGAFINDVCVGVAHITADRTNNTSYLYLTIRGKADLATSPIDFKFWDSSTGEVYALAPGAVVNGSWQKRSITFHDGAIEGLMAPVEMRAANPKMQTIALNKGWNWISLNVDPAEDSQTLNKLFFNKSGLSEDDIIQLSTSNFSRYQNNGSWDEGFDGNIARGNVYQLYSHTGGIVTVGGDAIEDNNRYVNLTFENSDWTGLAYLLEVTQPLNTALSDFTIGDKAPVGTVIKSYDEFAIAMPTGQWLGSLSYMRPGKGYYIYCGGDRTTRTVKYTNTVVSGASRVKAANAQNELAEVDEAEETVTFASATMMPVIAKVVDPDFQLGDQLVAYASGQMASKVYDFMPGETMYVSTHANFRAKVRFAKMRDGEIIAVSPTILTYDPNVIVSGGKTGEAMVIDFNEPTGIESLFEEADDAQSFYDLSGRKYDNDYKPITKGVFIRNGKKVTK